MGIHNTSKICGGLVNPLHRSFLFLARKNFAACVQSRSPIPTVIADIPTIIADILTIIADIPTIISNIQTSVDIPTIIADIPCLLLVGLLFHQQIMFCFAPSTVWDPPGRTGSSPLGALRTCGHFGGANSGEDGWEMLGVPKHDSLVTMVTPTPFPKIHIDPNFRAKFHGT